MKRFGEFILLPVWAVIASCFGALAQQPAGDAAIATIKKEYAAINSLSLQKAQFKYEVAGCVEDGVVTYYLHKDNIVKATESGSIGDGSWRKEFYYRSGKLFFCYEWLIGGPAGGKAVTTEYRYYIKDDNVIRCMENQKVIVSESKSSETIHTAYQLLKAYSTRDFAGALCD